MGFVCSLEEIFNKYIQNAGYNNARDQFGATYVDLVNSQDDRPSGGLAPLCHDRAGSTNRRSRI